MGFINGPAYVHKRIDIIFCPFREFARAYIDDIVIFSTSFEEHVVHLHCVFSFFQSIGMRLNLKKSYLRYLSVHLLGQRVTGLGLTTSEEKIAAIAKLTFPTTLKALETYLGMTGWLRDYIPFYAQKTKPLH